MFVTGYSNWWYRTTPVTVTSLKMFVTGYSNWWYCTTPVTVTSFKMFVTGYSNWWYRTTPVTVTSLKISVTVYSNWWYLTTPITVTSFKCLKLSSEVPQENFLFLFISRKNSILFPTISFPSKGRQKAGGRYG